MSFEIQEHNNEVTKRKGRTITSNGYYVVYEKSHPLSDKYGRLYEHRKIVYDEKRRMICGYCNIKLSIDTFHVDHINRDKSDNSSNNLIVTCQQCNNKRERERSTNTLRNRYRKYSFNGLTLSAIEWAEKLGIERNCFKWRIKNWGECERTFTEPKKYVKKGNRDAI